MPRALRDVVVVGGGPAGLALAAAAASRGLDVLVLERGGFPVDKACGEGVLPPGVRALEALGARALLDPTACSPLRAIRWIDGGVVAEASLAGAGALGVRRTALSAALAQRARDAGAELREGVVVRRHRRGADAVAVETDHGERRARFLVAADGIASGVRRREQLEVPPAGAPRFGVRRHFLRPPWSDAVEVHFGDGAEAYVTPAGPGRVGIAILCEEAARASFGELLARFPAIEARVHGVAADSRATGSGPLARAARQRTLDRLALVGDAAGYVDAITGEGISLALEGALALAEALPGAIARGARREELRAWEEGEERRFARYAIAARSVLGLARRPGARRPVLRFLARHPRVFSHLVGAVVG